MAGRTVMGHSLLYCLTPQFVFAAAVVPFAVKVEVQSTHPESGGKEVYLYTSCYYHGAVFG